MIKRALEELSVDMGFDGMITDEVVNESISDEGRFQEAASRIKERAESMRTAREEMSYKPTNRVGKPDGKGGIAWEDRPIIEGEF